MIIPTDSKAFK